MADRKENYEKQKENHENWNREANGKLENLQQKLETLTKLIEKPDNQFSVSSSSTSNVSRSKLHSNPTPTPIPSPRHSTEPRLIKITKKERDLYWFWISVAKSGEKIISKVLAENEVHRII